MPVEINSRDLHQVLDLTGMGPDALLQRFRVMALTAMSHLKMQAQRELNSTRLDYQKAIQPVRFDVRGADQVEAHIDLVGVFPNMVEHGASPWDLRRSLLRPGTRNLRVSKEGHYYLAVPFRHGAPDGKSEAGTPMGARFAQGFGGAMSNAFQPNVDPDEARAMGRAAHREAKRLEATLSHMKKGRNRQDVVDIRARARQAFQDGDIFAANALVGQAYSMRDRNVKWGGRLDEGHAPIMRGRHVTDIFAGMVRQEKTYKGATQSSYMTWRMISTNPRTHRYDADGTKMGQTMERNWTHPGLRARNFMRATQQQVSDWVAQGAWGSGGAAAGGASG